MNKRIFRSWWMNGYAGQCIDNFCKGSERFNEYRSSLNVSVTANTIIAPESSLTADRVEYAGALGTGKLESNPTIPGGTSLQELTFSCYIKSASGSNELFRLKNSHGGVADNFSTDFTAINIWQRFSLSISNSADVGSGIQIVGIIQDSVDNSFDLALWGAQLNRGLTVLSYIKTTNQMKICP